MSKINGTNVTGHHAIGILQAADSLKKHLPWDLTDQGFQYWSEVHANLMCAYHDALAPKPRETREDRMLMFASPNVPEGYNTVLGFLATHRHSNLSDDPLATQRDGFWLTTQARERGLTTHRVVASHAMQAKGITKVNAYPLGLLAERFFSARKCVKVGTTAGPYRYPLISKEGEAFAEGKVRYTKRNPYFRG